MKKLTFLCALLCAACVAVAQRPSTYWGKTPFKTEVRPGQLLVTTATQIEAKLVIEEDFSLFTKGSPEQPDTENIAPGTDYIYEVDSAYTHTPNWSGYYVFQAGGSAAIGTYDYYGYLYGGHISTPEAELYGEATVSFRARRAGNSPTAGDLDLSLCDNTMGRLETKEFKLTSEWQEFSFTSNQGTFNNRNIFQFCTMGGTILIDDIKVTRVRNRVPGVQANQPINHSATEFVASWQRSTEANINGYLLSVWRKEMPEKEESGKVTCDFEGINIKADGQSIETEFPNYPRGWDIDVSSHGTKDMCTTKGDYKSGKQAINFDAELSDIPFTMSFRNTEALFRNFKEACESWKSKNNQSLLAMRALYDGIYQMQKEEQRQYISGRHRSLIAPAIKEIEHSFAEKNISVSYLAALCKMSEVYFRKIFVCCFGVSPKEYIIQKRMEYAKQLLILGEFEISEIAELCGYSEPCHFSREFSKRVGVNPSQYTAPKYKRAISNRYGMILPFVFKSDDVASS